MRNQRLVFVLGALALLRSSAAEEAKPSDSGGDSSNIIQALQSQVKDLQTKVSALEQDKMFERYKYKSLFVATITYETLTIADDEIIIWNSAQINPGGHYNVETGGYTAPYSGYYEFTVVKRSNKDQGDFWLVVDGERYVYNDVDTGPDGGSKPTGSFTVVVQLRAGQVVQVENDSSTLIWGSVSGVMQSWFTGRLLYFAL